MGHGFGSGDKPAYLSRLEMIRHESARTQIFSTRSGRDLPSYLPQIVEAKMMTNKKKLC